jgi:phosphopantetheine adenylyltransferase
MNVSEGIELGQITIGPIAYADDIVLLGDNIETIKSLGKKLVKTAEKVGLTVNDDKTEYLIVSRNNRNMKQNSILI